MKLYICSKFHENIDDRFKVIEWIRFETNNFKGALFCKKISLTVSKLKSIQEFHQKNFKGESFHKNYRWSYSSCSLHNV